MNIEQASKIILEENSIELWGDYYPLEQLVWILGDGADLNMNPTLNRLFELAKES